MSAIELSEHIKKQAGKASVLAISPNCSLGTGFAIPIPESTEEDRKEVDRELLLLAWTFERLKIRGKEYYVLFP